MTPVRTRFAPSPTGSLHLGNLRVALFNDLFVRGQGGTLVVRVEDTDMDRNVEGSMAGILEDLRWAGIEWQEGPDVGGPYGPYLQSQRGARHGEAARRLLEEGKAYLCFCTEEALEGAREFNPNAPGCPSGCREEEPVRARRRAEAGEEGAIRFAVPEGKVTFRDEIRGEIAWQGKDLGDFVILRSDGRATYNFAVVVDDVDMEITHVIRGSGHLSNTPKHALLFDALGAPRPIFAHLPMVLGGDRRKLSKREGALGVSTLRAEGYPPEGVVNYLSLLGWSSEDEEEILSRDDLAARMELGRVGASDTVMDPEKLRWVCAQHLARLPLAQLVERVTPWIDRARYPHVEGREVETLEVIRSRLHTYGEVNEHLELLYPPPSVMDSTLVELGGEEAARRAIDSALAALEGVLPFEAGPIADALRDAAREANLKGPAFYHPVRMAIMGARSGPDMGLVVKALGRSEVVRRLAVARGTLEGTDPGSDSV